jgi:Asp-tRNA(Asn)/Glu-tRNA(Gln) amidotransferase A subunit family amidase
MTRNNFFAAFMATVNFIGWCTQTYEYVMWLVSVLARSDSEKQKNYREAAEELNRIEGILDQMTLNNIHNHVYMRENVAPHEDEIRRSAINAIEYLESPNSTVAKDEFLNGAKLLEDSIIRIFERLLNQSVSGPSYLDSLRDSTKACIIHSFHTYFSLR